MAIEVALNIAPGNQAVVWGMGVGEGIRWVLLLFAFFYLDNKQTPDQAAAAGGRSCIFFVK